MAEGLVTDLIKQLLSIASREAEQEIRLVIGVDEEVQKLKHNLRTVNVVLNDAERRQVSEKAVKLWLQDLKDACYEMDDVVDEWNTAMIKSEIQKEEENADNTPAVKKKVCSLIPSPSCCFRQVDKLVVRQVNKLVLRHDIAHKIKEVNGKLDAIVTERMRYGFELTIRGNTPEVVERSQTTCFVDVSEICGRDKVKDDLVSILLGKGNEEERCPHVISLVGMGGIGKTTISQLVYNDTRVKAHFQERMWVCVSEPFDQCRVAKAIIEALRGDHDKITQLQSLLKKICDLIGRKKIFLVLDDVWTEDSKKWEPFSNAFKQLEGFQSSRILVTTRKIRVAEIMGSTNACMINLGLLSDKDCWLVFSKIAFSGKDLEQCKQLENLGRQIAKKCKGLPLAAKTLGSLMRFKSSEEWKSVLDSNLWELEDVENVVEKDLFGPLLLSYIDLPSPLKLCFSYCAVFPKDYVFDIDELVLMWMAHGYIESKENMKSEIMAREYFKSLTIRSLFQDFQYHEDDGTIIRCKMHDIVHDFAQSMSKNECFTIDRINEPKSNYRNARHLFLETQKKDQYPTFLHNTKNLRTLILHSEYDNRCFFGDNAFSLFQHFRCLRVLTLNERCGIFNELLDAVDTFIHLRYLDIVFCASKELSKSICNLCNLQTLKITVIDGQIEELPEGMGKLINLRHLMFRGPLCPGELQFPRGIEGLISLRTLGFFFVSGMGDSTGCRLRELQNLNQLQGSLEIRRLGNVEDVCEARIAQLKKKIHLRSLELHFSQLLESLEIRMKNDLSILNALESPPNLEYLCIVGCWVTTTPNWMMSLTKLKMLYLQGFTKLECLPPLGKLPFLESLKIVEANSLKKVGVEFLGIESKNKKDRIIQIFPNLKSLYFDNFDEWEEWIGIGGMREEEEDSSITIMPCLQKLTIERCPKLKSLPNFLRTTPLNELKIINSILSECCQRGTREDWPKIFQIPNLEFLRIEECQVTTLSRNWTMSFTKLKTLCLEHFTKLECLPPFGKLPFLESLKIVKANSLKKVGVEFLGIESENKKEDKIKIFPNLKSLEFMYLFKWEEWIGIKGMREEEEDSTITIMPCLQVLGTWSCPNLKSLPDFLHTTPLRELKITGSPILSQHYQRRTGEDWPKISHIPNININGEQVQGDYQEVNLEMEDDE